MALESQPLPATDPDALQAEILSLGGIKAARVVTSPTGRITEVHVVAEDGKSAKQVVRDIQTLALARFGIPIDYRVVSVVQLGQVPLQQEPATPARPVLSAVSWSIQTGRTTCRVELTYRDEQAVGEVSGPATAAARLRLAARAAVEAIHCLPGQTGAYDLCDALVTDAGGRRVAVVVLAVVSGRAEEMVTGAALVRSDEADAVARAVLDAVNRRFSPN